MTDLSPHEEVLFDAVLKLNAQCVVEIGTDEGNSTRLFASALEKTKGHLWSIDCRVPKEDWHKGMHLPQVTFVTQDSLSCSWGGPLIDLLFLDGDHHQEHVAKELRLYGPYLRAGSLIILHDTYHSEFGDGITQAACQFARAHQLKLELLPEGHGLGIIHVDHLLFIPAS